MVPIIHDCTTFLLVNKPVGLSCHRDDGEASVLDRVRMETGFADLHLVHRLDKMTSGLLLFAKGSAVAGELGKQFAAREMGKYYLALSDRQPKKKQGTVSGDMAAARGGGWKLLPTQSDPAVTQFVTAGMGDGTRLFLVRPRTGRTHQIRVALKAMGSPILGDTRYGGQAADRGYLHAYALDFVLDGECYRFRCAPREGERWLGAALPEILQRWGDPWDLSWPRHG